jgi:predicted DsbA family dithiol-disulfide isomerase
MTSLRIDVFSDIVCPWCFVGTTRLGSVLSAWGEPLDVELTYHPFLLDPSTPPEGIVIEDMLRKKYGADPHSMFARVEGAAKQAGIDLDLKKQRLMVPTIAAHTLLRHAAEKGTQVAFVRALFEAYFHDAKNIADEAVLTELALGHGFSEDEALGLLRSPEELARTRAETQEAVRLGIRGVPFFVFNGELAVSGAQQPEVFRQVIRQALGNE